MKDVSHQTGFPVSLLPLILKKNSCILPVSLGKIFQFLIVVTGLKQKEQDEQMYCILGKASLVISVFFYFEDMKNVTIYQPGLLYKYWVFSFSSSYH